MLRERLAPFDPSSDELSAVSGVRAVPSEIKQAPQVGVGQFQLRALLDVAGRQTDRKSPRRSSRRRKLYGPGRTVYSWAPARNSTCSSSR